MFFHDIIGQYRRGALARQINDKLTELAKACRSTNKGGEITVTLKIKPSKSGGNEFTFEGNCKTKVPQVSIPDAVFFIDEKGDVTRDDPAQTAMFDDDDAPEGSVSINSARRGPDLEAIQNAMSGG